MMFIKKTIVLVFVIACKSIVASEDPDIYWAVRLVDGDSPLDGRPEVLLDRFVPICDEYVTPTVAMVICRELGFSPINVTMKNESYQHNQNSFMRCNGDEASLMNDCGWVVYPLDKPCQSHQGLTCNGNIRLAHGLNVTQGNIQIYRSGQWTGICDHQPRANTATVICRQMGYESENAVLYMGSYFGPGLNSSLFIECTGEETSHEDCRYLGVPNPALCGEDTNLAVDCYGTFVATFLWGSAFRPFDDHPTLRGYTAVHLDTEFSSGYWCDDVAGATDEQIQQMKNIAAVICVSNGYSRFNPQVANTNTPPYGDPLLSIHTLMCEGHEDDLRQCVRRGKWLTGEYTCSASYVVVKCNKFLQMTNGTKGSNGRLEVKEETSGKWHPVQMPILDSALAKVACLQLGFESTNVALRHGNSFGRSENEAWPFVYTCAGSEAEIQDCQQDPWITGEDEMHGHVGVECDAPPIKVAVKAHLLSNEIPEKLTGAPEDALMVKTGSSWRLSCVEENYHLDTTTTGVLCHSLGYSRFRSGYSVVPVESNSTLPANDLLMRATCKGTENNITDCSLNVGEVTEVTCDRAVVLQCQESGTCPSPAFQPEKREINCYEFCLNNLCSPAVNVKQCSLEDGGGCWIDEISRRVGFGKMIVQTYAYCQPKCKSEFATSSDTVRTLQCCYGDKCNNPGTPVMRLDLRVRLLNGPNPSIGLVQISVGTSWTMIEVDDRDVPDSFLKMVCWEAGYSGGIIQLIKDVNQDGLPSVRIADYNNCDALGTSSCPYNDVRSGRYVLIVDCNVRSPKLRLVDGGSPNMGRLEVWKDNAWGTVCSEGITRGTADLVCKTLGFPGGCSVSSSDEPSMAHFRSGKELIHFSKLSCQGDETNLNFCEIQLFQPNQTLCTHEHDVGIICETGSLVTPTTTEVTPTTPLVAMLDISTSKPETTKAAQTEKPSLMCAVGTCATANCQSSTRMARINCNSTASSYCYREHSKSLSGLTSFRFGCRTRDCESGSTKQVNNEYVTTFCCKSAMCNTIVPTDVPADVAVNFTDVSDVTVAFRNTTENVTVNDVPNAVENVAGLSGIILTLAVLCCNKFYTIV